MGRGIFRSIHDEFPDTFRPHMYQLHQLYLNKLRVQRAYVSRSVVIDYVNNLESPRLMFAINYFQNKNKVECYAAKVEQAIPPEPIQNVSGNSS